MKLRSRRTRKRSLKRRHTRPIRRSRGGNSLVVKYDNVNVIGQQFKKYETVSQPSIEFPVTNKKYSLVMWDPDSPNPSFLHWLVINLENQNQIREKEILNYFGPNPPSGTHHYYFGLFEQQNTIQIHPPDRTNFNINEFLAENNLKEVSRVYMTVSANA
jgi:phosphatidylethanolamine-binding protein (PEBP) family uncharacterized protein